MVGKFVHFLCELINGFVGCFFGFRPELVEQFLLFFTDLARNLHDDPDILVTASGSVQVGYALASEVEYLSGLSSGRDLQIDKTLQSGNLDSPAEDRHFHLDGNFTDDIVALSNEKGMILDLDVNKKVSSFTTCQPSVPFLHEPQSGSTVDSRRDFDCEFLFPPDTALSIAAFAGILNDPPGTVAVGTWTGHGEKSLLKPHLSAS